MSQREMKLINRWGAKDNDIKYFSKYLPLDSKIIVEPFGGSFAVSSNFYEANDKYKYHINDSDPALCYIYHNVDEYIDILKKFHKKIRDDTENSVVKQKLKSAKMPEFIKKYLSNIVISKGYLKKKTNFNIKETDLKILENATITCEDYELVLKKYKNNASAFIFIDPPYLFSDNYTYANQVMDSDNSDMMYKIHDYMQTCKCKVMLVINDLKIIRWIYHDMYIDSYVKIYQMTKKTVTHLIIRNYK